MPELTPTDRELKMLRRARDADVAGGTRVGHFGGGEYLTVAESRLVGRGWLVQNGRRLRITDVGRKVLEEAERFPLRGAEGPPERCPGYTHGGCDAFAPDGSCSACGYSGGRRMGDVGAQEGAG